MTAALQQFYAVAPDVQVRLIGDRWDIPVAFADGAGVPMDLTAHMPVGTFYPGGRSTPVDLTIANGGVVVTGLGAAVFTLTGSQQDGTPGQTSGLKPQDPEATIFPVRLVIGLIDGSGQRTTYLIQFFLPVDPQSLGS